MSRLSNVIFSDNSLLLKLRCDNAFDEAEYAEIKDALTESVSEWKNSGHVAVDDFVAVMDLIQEFAGGSRFWSKEVAQRVSYAEMELTDIIHKNLGI